MKKIFSYVLFTLFLFFFYIDFNNNYVNNSNRKKVELINCIDGDTANIKYNDIVSKLRFLAINTKEIDEEYGIEASKYTCDKLNNSKNIEIEFDNNSDMYDKYNRLLAWVFVDNELLQLDLVKNGIAEVKYIYGDYKYLDELYLAEDVAKNKKLGLWQIYY